MPPRLKKYFTRHIKSVDRALNRYLPSKKSTPRPLYEAMRYSLFAGGKRLRPILVIAGAEVCGGRASQVNPTACAVELIHTYSLVHDDLPAMDDDDMRRGRPTNHKVYGDDLAILTGDSLLTFAFKLMSQNGNVKGIKPGNVIKAINIMSDLAGANGMVGGQVADIKADKGRWKKLRKSEFKSPEHLLKYIHLNKTAALIRASLMCGATLVGANKKQLKALSDYGTHLGLLFQVTDDILDRVGDKMKLGKKGSDKTNKKLTFPALYGVNASQSIASQLALNAKRSIRHFGKKGTILNVLSDFVLMRDH